MKGYQVWKGKATEEEGALPEPLAELIEEVDERMEQLAQEAGLKIMRMVMESELAQRTGGRRFSHSQAREGHRWGRQGGYVVFGGRKVSLPRPRMRRPSGEELPLASYRHFQSDGKLQRTISKRILLGLSSRNYENALWDLCDGYGIKRSSVSRHFVKATQKALKTLMERNLSELSLAALVIDGKEIKGHLMVVALGVDSEGKKQVLGLWQGATENATVCQHLLDDLIQRGVDPMKRYLVVTDGAKALKKALHRVFGERLLHQRCQVHKRRNVRDHLPKERQAVFDRRIKDAYAMTDHDEARESLFSIARDLGEINPSASRSLLEGVDETLTVHRLGIPHTLRLSLASTNLIESCFSITEHLTRNVKRWRNGRMVARWAATSLLEAEKRFRKVRGYRAMPVLMEALGTPLNERERAA